MGAGFTPGPWAAFLDAERGHFIDTALGVESTNETVIADNILGSDGPANAHLIAAAPEYHDAAEPIVASYLLNDCGGRSDDDALEISIRDLRALVAAHRKACGQ